MLILIRIVYALSHPSEFLLCGCITSKDIAITRATDRLEVLDARLQSDGTLQLEEPSRAHTRAAACLESVS